MSVNSDGYPYEDVFVFDDIIYAICRGLGNAYVYRNHNNSLIKLTYVFFPCDCFEWLHYHSTMVTNDHILQCCAVKRFISIMNRSGKLLWQIPIADIPGILPILCQVDAQGKILIADSFTNRLLVANAKKSRWKYGFADLVDLPDGFRCWRAVWFRHRLYVTSRNGRLLTFTPVDAQIA